MQDYNPGIIYCRHIKYSPGLVKSLRASAPYVVEVNTNDRKEFMLINPKVGLYNKLTRNVLYKSSSGLVAVTHELARDPDFTRYKKPTITVANGILGAHDTVTENESKDQRFRLGFIGTPGQPWHGLDKVFVLARKLPDFDFDIIGPTEDQIQEDKLIGPVPGNVQIYGYLNKDASLEVLKHCDVGISTLALDRKGLTEASPLKTREYMLLGLPVIIGYNDTDLDEETSFILNIGSGESNVNTHVNEISKFVLNSRNLNRQEIMDFALRRFDSREKESRRLSFLMEIASNE